MTAVYTTEPTPDWSAHRNEISSAYTRAFNRVGAQTNDMLTNFGFTAGNYNPATGTYSGGGQIDTANQAGQLQQMVQSQGHEILGAQDNAAARGLGSTGLAAQRSNLIRQLSGVQRAQAGSQLQQQYGAATGQMSDLYSQYGLDKGAVDRQQASWESQYTNDPTAPGGPQNVPQWLQDLLSTMKPNAAPGQLVPQPGTAPSSINVHPSLRLPGANYGPGSNSTGVTPVGGYGRRPVTRSTGPRGGV